MKKALFLSLAAVFLFPAISAAQCTKTDFMDWNIGDLLTAASIDPAEPVTGDLATTCDIGVYYSRPTKKGLVQNAKIHGARVYGVLVNAQDTDVTVDILSSSIYDIGRVGREPILDLGVAISYQAAGGHAKGRIAGNFISRYHFAGIWAQMQGVDVKITDNIINGWPNNEVGQHGILVTDWATVTIERNTVSGNMYTGGAEWWYSAGIDVQNVLGAVITENILVNNAWGINVDNRQAVSDGTPTRTTITNNRVACDDLHVQALWQAAITVNGYGDRIVGNEVTGKGYDHSVFANAYDYLLYGTTKNKGPK